MPPPRGSIHVYIHNIQTFSPLKTLGHQSQILCEASTGWVTNVYISNPGHMTKMTAMPIYGKNPSKIIFTGTGGLISMKLDMKYR